MRRDILFWPQQRNSLCDLPLLGLSRGKRIELGSRRTWTAIPSQFCFYRISIQPGDVMPPIERRSLYSRILQAAHLLLFGKPIPPMPLASHMPIHWALDGILFSVPPVSLLTPHYDTRHGFCLYSEPRLSFHYNRAALAQHDAASGDPWFRPSRNSRWLAVYHQHQLDDTDYPMALCLL